MGGADDHAGVFDGDEDHEAVFGVGCVGVFFMVVKGSGVAMVAVGDEDVGGFHRLLEFGDGGFIVDDPDAVFDVIVGGGAGEVGFFVFEGIGKEVHDGAVGIGEHGEDG